MQLEEPSFIAALRTVAGSGSRKLREVRAGRYVADARTMVRDWDALTEEIARLEAENARLHVIIAKRVLHVQPESLGAATEEEDWQR